MSAYDDFMDKLWYYYWRVYIWYRERVDHFVYLLNEKR